MNIQMSHSQDLSDYQWQNRVLILSDAGVDRRDSKLAFEQVTSQIDAWKERDVVVLFLANKVLTTLEDEKIKYVMELPDKFNGYLLIGKDGRIKINEKYPLIPKKVFDCIDGMPMRRSEMKERNQ